MNLHKPADAGTISLIAGDYRRDTESETLVTRRVKEITENGGSPSDDQRTRAAAAKRERTRARLIDAIMQLCEQYGAKPIVIEDVLQVAGVSRGTFYAHFNSIYDAMDAVSQRLSDELTAGLREFYRDLTDPVLRVTVGFQASLYRVVTDSKWGYAFASAQGFSDAVLSEVRKDFIKGRSIGAFQFSEIDAVVDLHVGAFIQAAHRLLTLRRGQKRYIMEIAYHDLRMLGVPDERARQAIEWASKDINRSASKSKMWRSLGTENSAKQPA